jgi:dienelactone hydrolase
MSVLDVARASANTSVIAEQSQESSPSRISQVAEAALSLVKQVGYHGTLFAAKVVVIPVLCTAAVVVVTLVAAAILLQYVLKPGVSTVLPHLRSVLDELLKILPIAAKFGFGPKGEELQKTALGVDGPEFVRITARSIQEGKLPILYAPGYLDEPETFKDECRKLAEASGCTIYIVKYRDKFQSIEEHAKDVSAVADVIFAERKSKDLIVFGHSMGGLSTATAMCNASDLTHIAGWVTMGTPFFGTEVAQVGLGKCARQMEPNSPFLTQLHANASKLTQIPSQLHIYSKTDHVVPFKDVPAFGESYECTGNKGHLGIRQTSEVRKKLLETIELAHQKHARR